MISGTRTVWIRSEWALVFQTHCARHRVPLLERCAVCLVEDPLFPITNGSPAIASCWKCDSALLSYDPEEKVSSILADVISLESAILALTAGFPPDPRWARGSSVQAFFEKLRNLIQYLTMPADDRMPPFSELSMRTHTGVVTFSEVSVRRRGRDNVLVLPFSAADDPCAPTELTCKFKKLGRSTI
jgi:hypothetical protein